MLNVNDIHRYPLRAAELMQSHDEMLMSGRQRPAVCAGGGPRGPDDDGDEKWKREMLELIRATHAMVSSMHYLAELTRPRSRGSAGERPLH